MVGILSGFAVLFFLLALNKEDQFQKIYGDVDLKRYLIDLANVLKKVPYINRQFDSIKQVIDLLGLPQNPYIVLAVSYAIFIFGITGLIFISPFFLALLLAPSLTVIYYERKLNKAKKELSKKIISIAEMVSFGVSAGFSPLDALERALSQMKGGGPIASMILGRLKRIRFGEEARSLLAYVEKLDMIEVNIFIERIVDAYETGSRRFYENMNDFIRTIRNMKLARVEKQVELLQQKMPFPVAIVMIAMLALFMIPMFTMIISSMNIF